ncbi:MAG: hypothetical protein ACM3ZE_31655 [Myxococcales bacterium]
MRQIKAYRSVGLLIAGTLLCAVSCVIETDDDGGGEGGTTNVATGGTTSTNTAKVGGATAKGGSTAQGGATATGGKTGAGGSTTAAAGSSSVAGTRAAIGGSSAITGVAGNAGTPGAGGFAGSSSSGVAGATGATCLDSNQSVLNPSVCPNIPSQCGTGPSPAHTACITAWATYSASVANEIQRCIALIPVSQDLCNVTQAALDFCVSSTVARVCPTATATTLCAALVVTCNTLDTAACQSRVGAALDFDGTAFFNCTQASTVADCNAKVLGCI